MRFFIGLFVGTAVSLAAISKLRDELKSCSDTLEIVVNECNAYKGACYREVFFVDGEFREWTDLHYYYQN